MLYVKDFTQPRSPFMYAGIQKEHAQIHEPKKT